jgi:hypothetical protein
MTNYEREENRKSRKLKKSICQNADILSIESKRDRIDLSNGAPVGFCIEVCHGVMKSPTGNVFLEHFPFW